jgi:tripartite-type tricarboxylate transporter receptor subunit TctC
MATPSPKSAGLLLTALFAVGGAPAEAPAQDGYPSRIIRVIVPTAPGGGSDTVARLIGQGLFERLGR